MPFGLQSAFTADTSGLATEATLATRASEATLATRASEATLATRASEATLTTRASEATLATRASEATLATRATAAAQTDGTQRTKITDGTDNADVTAASAAAVATDKGLVVALSPNSPLPFASSDRDAFGRLRTGTIVTLLDYKFLYDKQPLLYDEKLTGTGTSTFVTNGSVVNMTVTATNDRVVRQSRQYVSYEPGKGMLLFSTGVMRTSAPAVGCTARIGLFDDNADKTFSGADVGGDGCFFQLADTTLSVVIRSYVSGSQVDTVVNQASWNVDKFDGTGPSGITIDTTKTQIFVIDLAWLGSGRARFGFCINGVVLYCHQIEHANIGTVLYMRTASLPARYEITRTSGTGAVSMLQGCASVASEGGYSPHGLVRTIDSGITVVPITSTLIPILSVRLAPNRRGLLTLLSSQLVVTTTGNVRFEIRAGFANYNQVTLTGAVWTALTDSIIQFDKTASALSGGIMLVSGYTEQTTARGVDLDVGVVYKAASGISGEPDIVTLCAQTISGNASVLATLTSQEVF